MATSSLLALVVARPTVLAPPCLTQGFIANNVDGSKGGKKASRENSMHSPPPPKPARFPLPVFSPGIFPETTAHSANAVGIRAYSRYWPSGQALCPPVAVGIFSGVPRKPRGEGRGVTRLDLGRPSRLLQAGPKPHPPALFHSKKRFSSLNRGKMRLT